MAGIDRAADDMFARNVPQIHGGNVFRFADTKDDSTGNGKPDWLDDILSGDSSDDDGDDDKDAKDDSKKESRRRVHALDTGVQCDSCAHPLVPDQGGKWVSAHDGGACQGSKSGKHYPMDTDTGYMMTARRQAGEKMDDFKDWVDEQADKPANWIEKKLTDESDKMDKKTIESMVHRAHRGQTCDRWSHGPSAPAAYACIEQGNRHVALCKAHYQKEAGENTNADGADPENVREENKDNKVGPEQTGLTDPGQDLSGDQKESSRRQAGPGSVPSGHESDPTWYGPAYINPDGTADDFNGDSNGGKSDQQWSGQSDHLNSTMPDQSKKADPDFSSDGDNLRCKNCGGSLQYKNSAPNFTHDKNGSEDCPAPKSSSRQASFGDSNWSLFL